MNKTIIIVFLFIFAFSVFLVFPATTGVSNCFASASDKAQTIEANRDVSNDEFCKIGQDNITTLNNCLIVEKNKNFVAPLLLKVSLAKSRGIEEVVNKYNDVCTNTQIKFPPY